MKLHEMRGNCRMCGKELKADTMDDMFVSFYCMKCGIYTTKPVEDFKDDEKETEAAVAEQKPDAGEG
ncbi:MAG: hypothetical protein OEM29_07205 [Thermoplasmata archaeon]|nr:hypothetical protein [Thermoplasmata archaeon]